MDCVLIEMRFGCQLAGCCRDAVLFMACWLSALLNAKTCAEVGLDVRREVR